MTATVFPTIHLNGTSKEALVDAYLDARWAILDAMEKLGYTAPNGRDYHPQGNSAFSAALEEHRSRLLRLNDVAKELEAIIEAIQ